jgi:hypothetical protein
MTLRRVREWVNEVRKNELWRFFIQEGKRSTSLENGIAHLDCSLADQHLCVALYKADASAHCSACTCCRASRGRHGRDSVLGGHAFVNQLARRWLYTEKKA